MIEEVQAAGATPFRKIAAALNARSVSTAESGAWSAMQVKLGDEAVQAIWRGRPFVGFGPASHRTSGRGRPDVGRAGSRRAPSLRAPQCSEGGSHTCDQQGAAAPSRAARDPDPRDPILLEPPHQVEDALTLVHGLNKVRMASLDAPNRHAVCLNEDESLWACGLRARAALHNLISGEVIACMRVAASNDGFIPVRCTVSGTDLGGALVVEGWARPVARGVSTGPRLRLRSVRGAVCGPAGGGSGRLRREPDGLLSSDAA